MTNHSTPEPPATPKLCVDCKHHRRNYFYPIITGKNTRDVCNASLVDGTSHMPCEDQRYQLACGPTGKLWEPKA